MKLFLAFILTLASINQVCGNENSIVNYVNEADVVSYTCLKADGAHVERLKQTYKGLRDEQFLDSLLQKESYIEVLNHLWTEEDSIKKINWLEKKVAEGHAVLMFELGEEYYTQNPSIETYIMKSTPWLMAAYTRCVIDAACTSDSSVLAAPDELVALYQDRVTEALCSKYAVEEIESFITDRKSLVQENILKITQMVLRPFLEENNNMPSPVWIFSHELKASLNQNKEISKEDLNLKRAKLAQELLQKMGDIVEQ